MAKNIKEETKIVNGVAESWLIITETAKDGTLKGKSEYRVDANFVPTDISAIHNKFIENYCAAHGEIDWLLGKATQLEVIVKKVKVKNPETGKYEPTGETKEVKTPYPFVKLRSDFANKFFPNIIKGEAKTETFADYLKKKYGK